MMCLLPMHKQGGADGILLNSTNLTLTFEGLDFVRAVLKPQKTRFLDEQMDLVYFIFTQLRLGIENEPHKVSHEMEKSDGFYQKSKRNPSKMFKNVKIRRHHPSKINDFSKLLTRLCNFFHYEKINNLKNPLKHS